MFSRYWDNTLTSPKVVSISCQLTFLCIFSCSVTVTFITKLLNYNKLVIFEASIKTASRNQANYFHCIYDSIKLYLRLGTYINHQRLPQAGDLMCTSRHWQTQRREMAPSPHPATSIVLVYVLQNLKMYISNLTMVW